MNTLKEYIAQFFNMLNIDSDKNKEHYYKDYISTEIMEFLDDEIKREAYDIYSLFLDIYRDNISGKKSFVDILDVLRKYEENASTLNDKQRDHYIHSINVFLLGIAIYSRNNEYRKAFETYISNDKQNIQYFTTVHEEFFFRWGIAALFHDIGYPVEIINNQFNKFIAYVFGEDAKGKPEARPYLSYFNFDKINSIKDADFNCFATPKQVNEAISKKAINQDRISEYIALNLSSSLDISLEETKNTLNGFLATMQKYQFVDHGFYSAIIVIKWFGELMIKKPEPSPLLFSHVLDSAAAIFLHNAYRNVFTKEPFSLAKLHPSKHPIGFLLILCDEVQEWNREAYGVKSKQAVFIDSSNIEIGEKEFKLNYSTKKGVLTEEFIEDKKELLNKLLDCKSIFQNGILISATSLTEQFIGKIKSTTDEMIPRLLIEHIEAIAKKIHENYNIKKLTDNPEEPLEYPTWESLPDTLKYSNVRQARGISDKLRDIGFYVSDISEDREITQFLPEQIEILAELEHEAWNDERIKTGWVYAKEKNAKLKKTPYLVPYTELSEEIKDYDRDAMRNIIPLLNEIGLKVFKSE